MPLAPISYGVMKRAVLKHLVVVTLIPPLELADLDPRLGQCVERPLKLYRLPAKSLAGVG